VHPLCHSPARWPGHDPDRPAAVRLRVTQLLVGGAFATILVGIAAQESLSNVFAGTVLLLARPVDVGDPVLIKSRAMGGDLHGPA
jgi:small-conductance mechanosensitive channel